MLNPVPSNSDPRYTYINWVPRWFSATTVASSTTRQLYWDAILSPRTEIEFTQTLSVPNFFGSVSSNRRGYIAKYVNQLNYSPTITLNTNSSSIEVERRVGVPDLQSEYLVPAYAVDPSTSTVYFKNLAVVKYAVASVSGFIDFNNLFSTDPPVDDWLMVLGNWYQDIQFIEPEDPRWNGNQLSIGFDTNWYVWYESASRYNQIVDGNATLTISGQIVSVQPYTWLDSWDEYSWLNGYKRHLSETNFNLRNKNQQLSWVPDLTNRISSMLGCTTSIIWNPSTSYVIPVTSVSSFSVPQVEFISTCTEQPVKLGLNWLLNQSPTSEVELFYKSSVVDPLSYVVSGSTIISGSILLQSADPQFLVANYQVTNYSISSSGSYTVINGRFSPEPVFLFVSDSVQIQNSFNFITKFNWDLTNAENLTDLVNFNT